MRIAFDGSTLTPGRTGVGYYTEHLLQHLAREVAHTGDELVVLSNQPIDTAEPLPDHVRVYDARRFPIRVVWMQLLAARILDELRIDVAHFTNGMVPLATRAARVVTIHDMSLELFPRFHPMRRRVINRPLVGIAARVADQIVAVSHSAKHDMLRLHRIPADRVSVVHEAPGPSFVPIRDTVRRQRVRLRYGLPHRFFLYVGAIEPRKNLPRLMEAFAAARADGLSQELVCVGPYGWASRDLYAMVDRLGLGRVVHFTGYVPVEDLPVIYNLSESFVFPSVYEGFGLPVVEAMACGVPVITTRSSSLTEIAGGAAELVDPLDIGALAAALTRLGRDEELRRQRAALGLTRAAEFSWTNTARQMLSVYRRAAGVTVSAPEPAAPPAAEARVAVEAGSREVLS